MGFVSNLRKDWIKLERRQQGPVSYLGAFESVCRAHVVPLCPQVTQIQPTQFNSLHTAKHFLCAMSSYFFYVCIFYVSQDLYL